MPVPSPFHSTDQALAQILEREGMVAPELLRACLAEGEASLISLAQILLAKGFPSERLEGAYRLLPSSGSGPLHLGEVVGSAYRVVALLGQGGMGAVYRVRDLTSERDLALKVILPDSADELDLLRFQREGEVAARLSGGGGFVCVHAGGQQRGLPYFVMELVEGQDLEAALGAGISPSDLSAILRTVARSLHACHQAGLVHRDLKPANILLGAEGPKIADLGLVRDRNAQTLTLSGEILGTPAYMAPEQIEDARSVDARTDVYALGAILYQGLAGRPPFSGSWIQVLSKVVSSDPPRPSELNPGSPKDLETICLQAMAKDPDQRYPNAAAFADDLDRALAGQPILALGVTSPRRGLALGATLTLLVLAGVLGGLALRSGTAATPTPSLSPTQTPTPDAASAARVRLRADFDRLFALGDLRPALTIRREATKAGEVAREGRLTPDEIRRIKLARWRAAQPAWKRRLEEVAATPGGRPAPAFKPLRAVLEGSPRVDEGVAELTSQTFALLLGRSEIRAAIALHLERARLGIRPPRALQDLVLARYRDAEETYLDCLRVDIPLSSALSTARRTARDHAEEFGSLTRLPVGQLRGYLRICLTYRKRTLPLRDKPKNRAYVDGIARDIPEVFKRERDLGARARIELKWLQLTATLLQSSRILLEKGQPAQVIRDAREQIRNVALASATLTREATGPLVPEIAEVESGAWERLGRPDKSIEALQRAVTHLERELETPLFHECSELPLGKVLVNLARRLLVAGRGEEALAEVERALSLIPRIRQSMVRIGVEPTAFEVKYLARGITAGLEVHCALGSYEAGESLLKRLELSAAVLRESRDLGRQTVLLAIARKAREDADHRLDLVKRAKAIRPEEIQTLSEDLEKAFAGQ